MRYSLTRRRAIGLGAGIVAGAFAGPARASSTVLHSSKVGNPHEGGYDVTVHASGATAARLRARIAGGTAGPGRVDSPAVPVNADGYATLSVQGMLPFTRYEHAIQLQLSNGRWRTHGTGGAWTTPTPGSVVPQYVIDDWGCHRRDPSHLVFDSIAADRPHLVIQHGDIDYANVDSVDYHDHLAARETQLALVPAMARCYADNATITKGSDHDWDGGKNTNHGGPWTVPSITAYSMAFPHLPIPMPVEEHARCGSLLIGRTLLIDVDTRSDRRTEGSDSDDPTQTALGVAQRDWARGLIQAATTDPAIRRVGFLSDFVWGGTAVGKPDAWCRYRYERDLLAADMAALLAAGKRGFIYQGDNHGGFGDDGTNNPYGGWAVFGSCGALRNSGNARGDTVYQHEFPPRDVHQPIELYGRLTLLDNGGTDTPTTFELVDALAGAVRFTVAT